MFRVSITKAKFATNVNWVQKRCRSIVRIDVNRLINSKNLNEKIEMDETVKRAQNKKLTRPVWFTRNNYFQCGFYHGPPLPNYNMCTYENRSKTHRFESDNYILCFVYFIIFSNLYINILISSAFFFTEINDIYFFHNYSIEFSI